MLIGGRKIVNSDVFFAVTNIRTNVQNYSSEFEGLLHEIVSKKPFMSQVICYINGNDETKLWTVSAYIKYILSILEIENKNVSDTLIWRHQLNYLLINWLYLLMGYILRIRLGKLIIQNVQYWQMTLLFWMSYFIIISRNHCWEMLYVKIAHQVVLIQ